MMRASRSLRFTSHRMSRAAFTRSALLLKAATPSSSNIILPGDIDENLTRMHFLNSQTALVDGAKTSMEVCERLYKLLEEDLTPNHRHDVLDSMSNTLCLVLDPCEFVRHMHPYEEYRHASQEAFSLAHQFMCELNGSLFLYEQLKILSTPEAVKALSEEENKNVAQLRRDMESNGIHLPDRQRKRVTEFNVEREEIAAEFLHEAGQNNPIGTLQKLLRCRHAFAECLGFESFADKELRGTILNNPEKVWHFLCAVSHKYWLRAEDEVKFLNSHRGATTRKSEFTDEDRARLTHAYRAHADALELEKYFSVANCWKGIEILCSEVFGLTLVKMPMTGGDAYHPDAEKYAVVHEKEGFMGTIIVDLFARSSKACQAGHLTVQLGCRPHREVMKRVGVDVPDRQYPIVVLTCNAGSVRAPMKNTDGSCNKDSTLMSPHEVTTLFHEFGHAVHTIFGQTQVQNLAGTRSSIDFVETFSQLFEQFLTSPEFVRRWARDFHTGEPIPADLLDQYNESKEKLRALDIMDQVVMSGIDQALHGPQPVTSYFPKPGSSKGELAKRVHGCFDDYGKGIYELARLMIDVSQPLSPVKPTERGILRSLSMEHMASYPSMYYGYLYSAVFARRIWEKFFKENPLSREEGERLRTEVLRHGAACNPRDVLQSYLKENLDDLESWV
eukprot:PhM_4_TR4613/c0_g1_i1/m.95153/K01410/MIPEP; mitochondrial intermediate peptidase